MTAVSAKPRWSCHDGPPSVPGLRFAPRTARPSGPFGGQSLLGGRRPTVGDLEMLYETDGVVSAAADDHDSISVSKPIVDEAALAPFRPLSGGGSMRCGAGLVRGVRRMGQENLFGDDKSADHCFSCRRRWVSGADRAGALAAVPGRAPKRMILQGGDFGRRRPPALDRRLMHRSNVTWSAGATRSWCFDAADAK